jgi:hypothetical protein
VIDSSVEGVIPSDAKACHGSALSMESIIELFLNKR